MASASGIYHPKPTRTWSCHFAAYGFVQGVKNVYGQLKHQGTGNLYPGTQIHPPSSDTGFWVIHFVLDNTFPVGGANLYTLEVFNADLPHVVPILSSDPGLTFSRPGYGVVDVSYPVSNDQVGSQFAAYGTAPNSTDVVGTYTGCSGSIRQGASGPDWVLYCMDQGAPGSQCTLTVSQSAAGNGQGTFVIGP